jgi:hypothetical protein
MNFTVRDILGILAATVALSPFLFAPGLAIGWTFNLFGFRQRRTIFQFLLAVPLSIAIVPIASFLLARYFPLGLWMFFVVCTLVALAFAWNLLRVGKNIPRRAWIGIGMVTVWVVIAIGSLLDLQIGKQLYPPISAYDHSTRVAMMGAISRQVPPHNPFFAHPNVPLRYHYLWILVCGLPLKLAHLSLRHLTYAGVIWCGFGLISLVGVGLRLLMGSQPHLSRKLLIGISLLCLTGLDILPTVFRAAVEHAWLADMEWWNEVQITSWSSSLLWVPHNTAALIACMMGFLLLHEAAGKERWDISAVLIAAVSFASAAGLSVYVSFTFVVAVGLWMIALTAIKRWKELTLFLTAGMVALIVASPFLRSISGSGRGGAFVQTALRPFPMGVYLVSKVGWDAQSTTALIAVNGLFLPLNYFLELGFFLVVGLLRFKRLMSGSIKVTSTELAAWTLVTASFLIGTFLRSGTIETNDLGTRCFLPAQFVMLLWGASAIDEWLFEDRDFGHSLGKGARLALAGLVLLGVIGTGYELFMSRFFPILIDRERISGAILLDPYPQSGERTYALRSLYEALDAKVPSTAVIQHNPLVRNPVPFAIYSGHDVVASGTDCGITFGGEKEGCFERTGRLFVLYQDSADDPQSACRDYAIDVVVTEDRDPVWQDRSSWVWNRRAMVENNFAKAFDCRSITANVAR